MERSAQCKIAAVAIWLGLAAVPALAQTRDDPEWQLTGGSSRAWVLQRFVRPATPESVCSAGKVYTFAMTHELTVSWCRNGRVVQSCHIWSITEAGGQGPTLAIAGIGAFLLQFQKSGAGGSRARLRMMSTRPGPDVELSLDED